MGLEYCERVGRVGAFGSIDRVPVSQPPYRAYICVCVSVLNHQYHIRTKAEIL